jgi:hypothetical protein
VVQLSDSTSTTSSVLASTPTATKSAYDLAASAYAPAFTNNYFAAKNKIINANMGIWQRGTSFTVGAASPYTADRFQANRSGLATGLTVTRQTTSDTTNLPFIQYCARVQRDSGNTSTATNSFWQNVETVNSIPFAGKAVVISFYARAGANYSATSSFLQYNLYSGTGTDQNVNTTGFTGSTQVITGNATLTTTWQRFTATASVASTATQLAVLFVNTNVGTAGANDYYEITGVQLEVGSVATPFTTATGTVQGELAACQRYYWRAGGQSVYQRFGQGAAGSTTNATIFVQHPVTMRIAPSSIDYSTIAVWIPGSGYNSVSSASIDNASTFGANAYVTTTSLTLGQTYALTTNNSTSGYLGFSAEL